MFELFLSVAMLVFRLRKTWFNLFHIVLMLFCFLGGRIESNIVRFLLSLAWSVEDLQSSSLESLNYDYKLPGVGGLSNLVNMISEIKICKLIFSF